MLGALRLVISWTPAGAIIHEDIPVLLALRGGGGKGAMFIRASKVQTDVPPTSHGGDALKRKPIAAFM